MFAALKQSVVEAIKESTWPDEVTKAKALRKAGKLHANLIAPKRFFNATFLENMVASVSY